MFYSLFVVVAVLGARAAAQEPSAQPSSAFLLSGDCGLCDEGQYVAVVNFEGLSPTVGLTEICVDAGVEITGWSFPAGTTPCFAVDAYSESQSSFGAFGIYNAELPGCGPPDEDLCVAGQGLVSIISNHPSTPNDDANGGNMTFDFTVPSWSDYFETTEVLQALLIDIDTYEENPPGSPVNSVLGVDMTLSDLTPGPVLPEPGDNSLRTDILMPRVPSIKKFILDANGASLALGEVLMCVTPKDRCVGGILSRDGTICCSGDCATCGGCDCADTSNGLPGPDQCCLGAIRFLGLPCLDKDDTGCVLDPQCPFVEPPPFGNCPH
eukprot:scaffold1311_cov256-Pinguiococcus_pyrenoidosus.AAC.8